jgi:phenylacetate-CoA ligase
LYSWILNHIILPAGSLFFSGNFSSYLKQWQQYDQMTETELDALQQENLSKIIDHACATVPYYRDLKLPPNPTISDFPILTKTLLRRHSDALISDKYTKKDLQKHHSSGSSGVQSFTYMTPDHVYYIRAIQTHWWKWSGYKPGEPMLQTGISPKRSLPKKLKDLFFRVYYLEAFSMTEEEMKKALGALRKKAPKHIAGYPSAINELAKYAIKNGETFKFKTVISYGDKLFDHYIENFNRAFGQPQILNTYGCAEGYLMACKSDLPYFYVMSPHVYLEIVDDDGIPVKDGERGHILVSGLTNFAMPLLRYKLGDLGVFLPRDAYPETRKFQYPLLKEITGRETDVIKTPDGAVLVVHSFTGILEYFDAIKQYKVVQEAADRLQIQYLTDDATDLSDETLSEVRRKLEALVKDRMKIAIVRVKTIAPSPSGKPQIIEVRDFAKD